jgi:hypothetical protein
LALHQVSVIATVFGTPKGNGTNLPCQSKTSTHHIVICSFNQSKIIIVGAVILVLQLTVYQSKEIAIFVIVQVTVFSLIIVVIKGGSSLSLIRRLQL